MTARDPAWRVLRQDDNGNQYPVGGYETRALAEAAVKRLEAGGHKQLYWIEAGPAGHTPGGGQ